MSIATDSSGNVYVVDSAASTSERIQKFDSNSKFITKWGKSGDGDGQFNSPKGVATDSSGSVYVVDNSNNRIQKFDSDGKFVTKWGEYGFVSSGAGAEGKFNNPKDVATDS